MKGIESVMRGYAEGGSVNPFQAYAGSPTYSPFDYLGMAAEYAPRPPVQINAPQAANPLAPAAGGYQNIYGNLEAIKAAQAAKRAADAAAKVVPEAPAGQGTSAGDGSSGTGFSSTPQGTPGSGFNVPGIALGAAGLVAGIPGAGALGSALGTQAANDYLAAMGLSRDVSTLEALKSGLSFGLFGQSPQTQADEIIGRALGQGFLDPDVIDFVNEKLTGPTVAAQYGAQVESGERSASGAFFDAINDLNTVGRLSEVLGAIDSAEKDRQTETNRATDVLSAIDFQASLDAAVNSGSSESQGSAPEGFSAGDGSQDPGGGWARGGYVPGGSGGMDDDVPAIIDGKGPARLSSGEFVFDAATVAALGDGNNQAGARKLDGLRKAIRKKAYGHEKQPPKNYSVGDLVRMHDRRR